MSIKRKIITTMLIVSMLPINVFGASPQTKQMIQDTLSKFCIPPKKENCNPREEGQYDPNYDFCLCEDDGMVYSKSERKCVECGKGTYYRRNMKDNECKDCPSGEFQPNSGQSECKKCNSDACYKVTNNRTKCEYDCTTPNLTACSRGTCVQCTNDSYCSGSTPYCSDKRCVECTSDSHCGSNYRCSGNSCVCNISCSCGVDYSDCSCNSCPKPDTGDDDNGGNTGGGGGRGGCRGKYANSEACRTACCILTFGAGCHKGACWE